MLVYLLLSVLSPGLGLEIVSPSPGKECSPGSECGTKDSCPYWLEREKAYKEGRDPTFVKDAQANICNRGRRALCCPDQNEKEDVQSPTYIPKAGDCGVNPEATPKFIFGGNETNPGDYPFSALLGW